MTKPDVDKQIGQIETTYCNKKNFINGTKLLIFFCPNLRRNFTVS